MNDKLDQVAGICRAPAYKGRGYFVYFLYLDDVVVYVGVTTTAGIRIMNHVASAKEFDHYCIVPVSTAQEMFELEFRGIVKHAPRYNKVVTATMNSGFLSSTNIRLAHGIDAETLKEMADAAGVEVLVFKGRPYYNAAHINNLLGVMA